MAMGRNRTWPTPKQLEAARLSKRHPPGKTMTDWTDYLRPNMENYADVLQCRFCSPWFDKDHEGPLLRTMEQRNQHEQEVQLSFTLLPLKIRKCVPLLRY